MKFNFSPVPCSFVNGAQLWAEFFMLFFSFLCFVRILNCFFYSFSFCFNWKIYFFHFVFMLIGGGECCKCHYSIDTGRVYLCVHEWYFFTLRQLSALIWLNWKQWEKRTASDLWIQIVFCFFSSLLMVYADTKLTLCSSWENETKCILYVLRWTECEWNVLSCMMIVLFSAHGRFQDIWFCYWNGKKSFYFNFFSLSFSTIKKSSLFKNGLKAFSCYMFLFCCFLFHAF